jgi:hypothetical protein
MTRAWRHSFLVIALVSPRLTANPGLLATYFIVEKKQREGAEGLPLCDGA